LTELQLPYPPSANQLWTRTKRGMRRTDKYEAWLWEAAAKARTQKPEAVEGPYKLTIQVVRPDLRKRDLDNLIKATNDLLVSVGVIEDDHYCEVLTARWVTTGEGMTVRVECAGIE
jgi:Holliday junction resolvase RusA-like endonuclease